MREYARLQAAMLLRRLADQVGRAVKADDPDSIHDLRVAIRRLNVCLRVFRQFYPRTGLKRIRLQLKAMMKLAGAVRDRDVVLALIGVSRSPAAATAAARLRDERSKACSRLQHEARLWKNRGFSKKWRGRLELSR